MFHFSYRDIHKLKFTVIHFFKEGACISMYVTLTFHRAHARLAATGAPPRAHSTCTHISSYLYPFLIRPSYNTHHPSRLVLFLVFGIGIILTSLIVSFVAIARDYGNRLI